MEKWVASVKLSSTKYAAPPLSGRRASHTDFELKEDGNVTKIWDAGSQTMGCARRYAVLNGLGDPALRME